jgi:hypothetical protein
MTIRSRILVLAVAAGCGKSTTEAAPSPSPTPLPSPAKAAPKLAGHADVRAVGKTAGGAEVLAVGQPRFQLGNDTSLGGLELRGGVVAAEDSHSVVVWELGAGDVVARVAPGDESPAAPTPSIALSPDGAWLAVGSQKQVRVLKRPFDKVDFTTPCMIGRAFSHDGKLLACHQRVPEIWTVAGKKLVAKAPDDALVRMPRGAQFSADDRALYWVTDHEIVRWEFAGSKAVTTVYKSADEIANVVFAAGADRAFVSTRAPKTYKKLAALVDLATGKATSLPDGLNGAVSRDGSRVAVLAAGEVRVLDAASSKVVWSGKYAAPVQRIAFAGDADVLAYVEGGHVHVVDLASGPRTYDAPSRFAGWIAEGVIATERDGVLEQLNLSTHAWSKADRAALDIKPPAGMPAWVKWLIAAPNGAVGAEAKPAACAPKLRVWTPKGGEKTLKLACSTVAERVDPGWEIGGGRVVGVANTLATLFDPATGKTIAALAVEKPRIAKPKLAHEYAAAALSPAGNALALISRGPQLPAPGTPDVHDAEQGCVVDLSGECWPEYLLAVYALDGTPKQLWQARVDNGSAPELSPQASGAVAFDHAGKRVLVGMTDGAIEIAAASSATGAKVERLHHARITRIVVSPGDGWVLSEDAAGEQRVWKLP